MSPAEKPTKKPKKKRKGAPRSTRRQVDNRIEHIAGMMQRFEWVTGDSHAELAKQWKVSAAAVEKYASAASRLAIRAIGDVEQIRAWGLSAMQRLTHAAASNGEIKTAMHGVSETMRLSGADQPQKIAITTVDGRDVLPPHLERKWDSRTWAWWLRMAEEQPTRIIGEAEMVAFEEELKRQDELAKADLP